MSVATKLRPTVKPTTEPHRAILGPTGNRVRVLEESKRKTEALKKPQQRPKKPPAPEAVVSEVPEVAVKKNLSVDSTCSSHSSSSSSSSFSSSGRSSRRIVKRNGLRPVKVVPEFAAPNQEGPAKRCDWITPNSGRAASAMPAQIAEQDPLYTSFHDEEWGVPVHDDRKLFELLVFSQALAELSWSAILHMRDIFRKLFDNFDLSSIAQYSEKKLLSLKVNGNLLLSEPKLRAIVENAKQICKVQQEFGSFSNYCWRFVNHKPLRNGFRYARQVPVKTPKAELISKDLMQRGFRCVGPTVVYSFMQVAGIVNDHLVTCFRCKECDVNAKKDVKSEIEETEVVSKAPENACLSND